MQDRPRQQPSKRVEDGLRARMAAGEWSKDDRLPAVAALADYYAVSRTAVTAALRRLASEGLIEVVPHWGTFKT